MFREPLRRDPLVIGWALVMLFAGVVALSNNTEWSGSLEADRVIGFLEDVAEAFLWSFVVLLLLAWLRAKGWRNRVPAARKPNSGGGSSGGSLDLPWTDRWLRDWREADAQQGMREQAPELADEPKTITCRHGVPLDVDPDGVRAPVLRALSTSHTLVRPGSDVSVTWCFEGARVVEIDGRPGNPSCGEALVRVDTTRRIPVVGSNRHGSTPVATASVVAMSMPQLDLPTVDSPPIVSLRADVAAHVGAAPQVTRRLDDFWQTQDSVRPSLAAPPRLIGAPPRLATMPASVVDGIRRARPSTGEEGK
ncbi:hypothetical protein ABC795_11810 [Blastococcus sp. HT6-30]|uniref:hypothetical protein n=1 Tax=Blastococcus sp. HT6-30 TaxID=3144843 RepID=UPI00321A8A81